MTPYFAIIYTFLLAPAVIQPILFLFITILRRPVPVFASMSCTRQYKFGLVLLKGYILQCNARSSDSPTTTLNRSKWISDRREPTTDKFLWPHICGSTRLYIRAHRRARLICWNCHASWRNAAALCTSSQWGGVPLSC